MFCTAARTWTLTCPRTRFLVRPRRKPSEQDKPRSVSALPGLFDFPPVINGNRSMSISQLCFDFTHPKEKASEERVRTSWRVSTVARRYRLPPSVARFYANELGFPTLDAG